MKKFSLSLFITCICIFLFYSIYASAQTYGDLTYIISNDTITITDCDSSVTEVNIPEKIGDYPVVSIGVGAFDGCANLTDIKIPDSITNIGDFAFYNCSSLTKITIPDSIASIGDWTFSNCSNLKSAIIGKNVTILGDKAFYLCSGLKEIILPDSITNIGNDAFYGCSGFSKIIIPKNVTIIGDRAFKDCINLASITLPDNTTNIGGHAFYNTEYYNNESNWEDDFLYISIHLVNVKNTINGNYYIKTGTKTIGVGAFDGCANLTGITISDSITNIGDYAFYNCSGLTDVYYTGTEDEWSDITVGDYNSDLTNAKIHYNPQKTKTTLLSKTPEYDIYSVNTANIPTGSTIVFACYNDKKLVYSEIRSYNGENPVYFVELGKEDYNLIKVMAWEDSDSLKPICESEEIIINDL